MTDPVGPNQAKTESEATRAPAGPEATNPAKPDMNKPITAGAAAERLVANVTNPPPYIEGNNVHYSFTGENKEEHEETMTLDEFERRILTRLQHDKNLTPDKRKQLEQDYEAIIKAMRATQKEAQKETKPEETIKYVLRDTALKAIVSIGLLTVTGFGFANPTALLLPLVTIAGGLSRYLTGEGKAGELRQMDMTKEQIQKQLEEQKKVIETQLNLIVERLKEASNTDHQALLAHLQNLQGQLQANWENARTQLENVKARHT